MAGWPQGLTYRRRLLVGQLWCRGYSEREIAEMIRAEATKPNSPLHRCISTTHVTVHHDVVACRQEWLALVRRELDETRADQVARLLDTIHQAWADHAQCKRGRTVTETTPEGATIKEIEANTWYLRPVHMRVALEAEALLARIMGTQATAQLFGEGDGLVPSLFQVVLAEGTKIIPGRMSGNGDKPEVREGPKRDDGDGHH